MEDLDRRNACRNGIFVRYIKDENEENIVENNKTIEVINEEIKLNKTIERITIFSSITNMITIIILTITLFSKTINKIQSSLSINEIQSFLYSNKNILLLIFAVAFLISMLNTAREISKNI